MLFFNLTSSAVIGSTASKAIGGVDTVSVTRLIGTDEKRLGAGDDEAGGQVNFFLEIVAEAFGEDITIFFLSGCGDGGVFWRGQSSSNDGLC